MRSIANDALRAIVEWPSGSIAENHSEHVAGSPTASSGASIV